MRGQILGSKSFPEHWYGMGGDVTGASAKEMGAPPLRRLTRRQNEIKRMVETLCRFALQAAIRMGRLAAEVVVSETTDAEGNTTAITRSSADAFTVAVPEISSRDTAQTVAASVSLAAALTAATNQGWMRPETCAKVFANLVSQLGIEVDPSLEYSPGGGPNGAAAADYAPANLQRILAQMQRMGNGNGDNVNREKTPVPGGTPA